MPSHRFDLVRTSLRSTDDRPPLSRPSALRAGVRRLRGHRCSDEANASATKRRASYGAVSKSAVAFNIQSATEFLASEPSAGNLARG